MTYVQVRANHMHDNSIDEVLKGALLTLTTARFLQLSQDFLRLDCTKIYADMCDELRNCEDITPKRQQQTAMHVSTSDKAARPKS